MDKVLYQNYLMILKEELVPALGCTEPIALAYATSKAREVLGEFPDHMEIRCSGNIIKNIKGVTVPNSGGLKGIDAAAILGVTGGDPSRELEVLGSVTPENIKKTHELLEEDFCECFLAEGVENLYICARVTKGNHSAEVTIVDKHTRITCITKDDEVIFELKEEKCNSQVHGDKSLLNVKDILNFADEVEIDDIRDVIGRQIQMNKAISDEGLKNRYGAEVGRTLLNIYGDDIKVRARARAAAGSDARMNGCSMPVVINSGSGNQGMTCSLPVVELMSIHQKKFIGSLSAYCGAVSAACGAGAAITYLYGGDYQKISKTITNTIANVGGIVCDGAKSSCAAKIASAVEAAIMAHFLGEENHCFHPGDGIVKNNVEETIRNIGYIGKVGMKSTDVTILNLMIDKIADI